MCDSCEEDEAFFMAYYAKARAQLPKAVPPSRFSADGFAATPSLTTAADNRFACDAPASPDQKRS